MNGYVANRLTELDTTAVWWWVFGIDGACLLTKSRNAVGHATWGIVMKSNCR